MADSLGSTKKAKERKEGPEKNVDEGHLFEEGIATQTFLWLSDKKFYDFKLGVELQGSADKFDDVIFSYKVNKNDKFQYTFLQLKHGNTTKDDIKPLLWSQLVHSHDPDKKCPKPKFCLKVYFESFRDKVKKNFENGKFQDGILENVVLLTNRIYHNDEPAFQRQKTERNIEEEQIIMDDVHGSAILEVMPDGDHLKFSENDAQQLMETCKIPQEDRAEFEEFLKKFILSVNQPSQNEIDDSLKENLGTEYDNMISAIRSFGKDFEKHWIIKRNLFDRKGLFQGNEVKLLSEILDEDLYQDLDKETIRKLIINRLEIGKPKEETQSTRAIGTVLEHLYIDRMFQIQNEIDEIKLKKAQNDPMNEFLINEENSSNAKPGRSSNRRTGTNIHHLKKENGRILWIKTEGKIDKLLEIRTENKSRYTEETLLTNSEQNKINIIAGEPGNGKSVALSHLAQTLKKKNPETWVQQINLVDLSSCFDSSDEDENDQQVDERFASKEACLEFLLSECLKIVTEFEKKVFRKRLSRVILLLDGFDEICPTYKEKCCDWIKGLAQLSIRQIWLSTRSQLQLEMEKEFSCIAYTIATFTDKDKDEFLLKYWKHKLFLEKTSYYETIAKKLRMHVSSAISESEDIESFIGIPLIMSMVAYIYRTYIESYHGEANKVSFEGSKSLIGIYRDFVQLKFQNWRKKYFPGDQSKTIESIKAEKNERKKLWVDHRLLGISNLFKNCPNFQDLLQRKEFEKIKDLTNEIHDTQEKRGVVYDIQNGTVSFMHKSFAEFFAADWFCQELMNSKDRKTNLSNFLKSLYFKTEQTNFRRLFSLILVEPVAEVKKGNQQPSPLAVVFQCVIHTNLKKLKAIVKAHPEIITEQDALGRNVLHAAIQTEDRRYEMSIFLIDQNNKIVYAKDKLFNKTPIEYLALPIPDDHKWYKKLSEIICKPRDSPIHYEARMYTIFAEKNGFGAQEYGLLLDYYAEKVKGEPQFLIVADTFYNPLFDDHRFYIFLWLKREGEKMTKDVKANIKRYLFFLKGTPYTLLQELASCDESASDLESESEDEAKNKSAIPCICSSCKKEKPDLKKCSGCKSVGYCSTICQSKDWGLHKSDCKRLDQERLSKLEGTSTYTESVSEEETKSISDAKNKSAIPIICDSCKKEKPDLKKCSGCKSVRYCSTICQSKDWGPHKSDCKKLDQERLSKLEGTSVSEEVAICDICEKEKPDLKKCSKCWTVQYCSEICFDKHELECSKNQSSKRILKFMKLRAQLHKRFEGHPRAGEDTHLTIAQKLVKLHNMCEPILI